MADAADITASSGIVTDPLIGQIQASLNKLILTDIPRLRYRESNGRVSVGTTLGGGTISNTGNGAFRVINAVAFKIGGANYQLAGSAAVKVWDLSAEAAVAAAKYRGYRLMLTSGGTASFTGTADKDTTAACLDALDALTLEPTKAVLGDFIAGPSTSFSADSLSGVSGALLYDGFGQQYQILSFRVLWG